MNNGVYPAMLPRDLHPYHGLNETMRRLFLLRTGALPLQPLRKSRHKRSEKCISYHGTLNLVSYVTLLHVTRYICDLIHREIAASHLENTF